LDRLKAKRELAKEPGFFKRHWQYWTSLAVVIGWMLTNSTAVMNNVEEFPGKAKLLTNKFLAWHYDDTAWNGAWSDDVEGFIGENPLTTTESHIRLGAEHGVIGGEISTKQLCEALPIYDFVMVEGKLSFGKVEGVAFDFFGGERKNLFTFTMRQTPVGLEITPNYDPSHLLPERMVLTRIATADDPTGMYARSHQEKYCEKERVALWGTATEKLGEKKKRKPVSELHYRGR